MDAKSPCYGGRLGLGRFWGEPGLFHRLPKRRELGLGANRDAVEAPGS